MFTEQEMKTNIKKFKEELAEYKPSPEPNYFDILEPPELYKEVPARRYHCQKCLAITEKKV